MSNRRGSLNTDLENVSKQIFDECLDEITLGVAFDIHRSVKTGLFAVIEPDSPNKISEDGLMGASHHPDNEDSLQVGIN